MRAARKVLERLRRRQSEEEEEEEEEQRLLANMRGFARGGSLTSVTRLLRAVRLFVCLSVSVSLSVSVFVPVAGAREGWTKGEGGLVSEW